MGYSLKEMNEMDYGLKEMNDTVTKVGMMCGWVRLSWRNFSVTKSITEERDHTNPNLKLIFSLAQYKCILCSHKHDLNNFNEYVWKSIEERRKFLARKKLCYCCYKPISISHNARTCNDRPINQTCQKIVTLKAENRRW